MERICDRSSGELRPISSQEEEIKVMKPNIENRHDILLVHVRVVHLNHRQFHQMTANNERLRYNIYSMNPKAKG